MIAADPRHRDTERVTEEAEVGRLEVATADDGVETPQGFSIDRVLERGVDRIRYRQQADRFAMACREWALVRPLDPTVGGSSVALGWVDWRRAVQRVEGRRFVLDRASLGRCPLAAVRSERDSAADAASDRIGSVRWPPGGTSSVTFASISS